MMIVSISVLRTYDTFNIIIIMKRSSFNVIDIRALASFDLSPQPLLNSAHPIIPFVISRTNYYTLLRHGHYTSMIINRVL